ncbi:MAG: redoxin domain-containing protein [Planctomycetes bacterium]|nr:redoxin domain-containing protein [Planctomycetota bacterium]
MAQQGPGGSQRDRLRGQGRPPRARRIPRFRDTLKVGEKAPDFELKTVDGKKTVRLSSFRGKRPVLLIFGSYT